MGAEGKFDLKVVSGGSGESGKQGRKSHSTPSLPDATAVDHQVIYDFSLLFSCLPVKIKRMENLSSFISVTVQLY